MSEPLFKIKQVKIDTLGEYLRQVRKTLNLDIKTVGILAQIKPEYLEKLEKGAYEQLPADVYTRGFLKSLANFYHIKEEILIDQYEKERGYEPAAPAHAFDRSALVSFTPTTLVVAASLFVALAAVIFIGMEIRSVLAPPYLSVNEPASDITIEGNSIVVSGVGEIGSEIYINNQPVLADRNGGFSETLLLSPGLNVIEITETNKFNKTSRVVRTVTSRAMEVATQPADEMNLIIQIGPNSAWVNLEADGIVVVRGTMLPGSEKLISAKDEIIITTANAGSTKIIYNGRDFGILGREGEVIRNVEFSPGSQF